MESVLVVEVIVAAVALITLGVAAWVEASLGTAREMTIRELLNDRLSRSPVSDVDETTQIRSAMVLIQMIAAGVSTGLIAHAALDFDVEGSLVIGLALARGRLDADAAFRLSQLDELYQAGRWGEDAEAAKRRKALRQELEGAARFLELARSSYLQTIEIK